VWILIQKATISALPQFIEQSRVLDSDNSLARRNADGNRLARPPLPLSAESGCEQTPGVAVAVVIGPQDGRA
jgi:hypothetical protein